MGANPYDPPTREVSPTLAQDRGGSVSSARATRRRHEPEPSSNRAPVRHSRRGPATTEQKGRRGVEAESESQQGGESDMHGEQAGHHSAHHRRIAVDAPSPRHEARCTVGDTTEPERKWQTHDKTQRREKADSDGDLRREREPHETREEMRQHHGI